ncbi:MAG: energy transducer TonB [Bdellovibrionaceae bacterium]|nr:energy transducer TonB [Pseudobdellovibrionaceae bacterium]
MGVNIVYSAAEITYTEPPETKSNSSHVIVSSVKKIKQQNKINETKEKLGTGHRMVQSQKFGSAAGARLNLEQQYLFKLREHIVKQIDYPRASRKLRQTGQVIVKLDIDRSGRILDASIEKKCPFVRLNQAALTLVRGIGEFAPFPKSIQLARISVLIPVSYSLK